MEQHLLPLTAFLSIVSAVGALLFGMRDMFRSKKDKKVELRQLVRILPRERDGEPKGIVEKFDRWFVLLLYQSGLGWSVPLALSAVIVMGLLVGSFVYVATENPAFTLLAAMTAMVLFVVIIAMVRSRRMKKFEELFPNSLDIMARAVRAGESLEQAVELVSNASQEPVASEFRRCSNQLEMGLSVPATMQSLSDRIGQTDVKIFSSTLSIHREGGGNLAESLDRLASLIRDRLDYRRQMRSGSSAGRFSVLIILILAPILLAYLFLFKPEYGMGLWDDPIGRWMLVLSIVGQAIGLFWVSRILKTDY